MSDVTTRIQKLLALAGNNPNEHEAESAMRAALKLAAKHNIDLKKLADKSGNRIGEMLFESHGRPWERAVCQAVGELYFCGYLYVKLGKKTCRHIFVGTEDNARVAAEISAWVAESIRRTGKREARGDTPFYNSFCAAAADRVYDRVEQMIAEAKAGELKDDETGKALVLASLYDQHHQANQDYIQNVHKPKTKNLRLSGSDEQGAAAGDAYGRTVGLNRQVSGAPRNGRLARS